MRIQYYLKHPDMIFVRLSAKGLWRMDDRKYIEKVYYEMMGEKCNLDNPKKYTEKIQYLKLYDHRPEYSSMVDKYTMKQWVTDKLGPGYVIDTLGVWDSFEKIDREVLPQQFVLKTTHASGDVVICKDKSFFDWEKARKKISKYLKMDFYRKGREWAYSGVKKRIIAEPYMEDKETNELRDYKFFGFDGIARVMFIAKDRQRQSEPSFDYFDMDFNHLDIKNGHPLAKVLPEKPKQFDKMKEITEIISKGYPHVRVDFYEVNGKIYIGELTLYHHCGWQRFEPEQWDYKFGEWIDLDMLKI